MIPRFRILSLGAAVLVAAVCEGCAREPEAPTLTSGTSVRPMSPGAIAAARLADGIAIAEEIRSSCALPRDEEDVPHFEFDSARLSPRGATILDAVGACLTSGSLRGRRVRIVGHTDAEGPREYNQQLGLYRAQAAQLELERIGVPAEVTEVASRGETDAKGSDPASRARDRRIEIQVLPLGQ